MNDLLNQLDKFCHMEHDFGPGLEFAVACFKLYRDGSGSLLITLYRKNVYPTIEENILDACFNGDVTKEIEFNNLEEAMTLISKSMKANYESTN